MTHPPKIECSNCHRPYPETGVPYRCQVCGGVFDFSDGLEFEQSRLEPGLPGIWRYRYTFPLVDEAPLVTLGEGNTPLEWREISGHRIAFKLEYHNPTGSFKDRGAAVLVSLLRSRGIEKAVEDSSGNAGAAFAAYASAGGVEARIFIPDATSTPKRLQIEQHGGQVVRIMGPRSNAAEAVLRAAAKGTSYASHAYLPHAMAGYATPAYECVEQMGGAPGAFISPVGQGNLLLGMLNGLEYVVRAARELQLEGRHAIAIMIVGAGGTARRLQTMGGYVGEHQLHILRNHMVAPLQQRPGTCCGKQRQAGAR